MRYLSVLYVLVASLLMLHLNIGFASAGIDIKHNLVIDDPVSGFARTITTISNLSGNSFELAEDCDGGLSFSIYEISARDLDGNVLGITHLPDQGSRCSNGLVDVWRVASETRWREVSDCGSTRVSRATRP